MKPEDFVIRGAYRYDVQSAVVRWCWQHQLRLNDTRPENMSKDTMARVVTEMDCVEAFFKLEGVARKKRDPHPYDHRAARIRPVPAGAALDLIADRDKFGGIEVGRYRRQYSNPDQVRLTEEDEQDDRRRCRRGGPGAARIAGRPGLQRAVQVSARLHGLRGPADRQRAGRHGRGRCVFAGRERQRVWDEDRANPQIRGRDPGRDCRARVDRRGHGGGWQAPVNRLDRPAEF